MSSYEYSSYSSSSTGGNAGGFDATKAIFNQVDLNQDGAIDRNEFQQWLGGAGAAGAGGASGNFESSSYESSNFSSAGGATGAFTVDAGLAGGVGGSSFESSSFTSGATLDAGADASAAGGATFQSSSFESSSTTGAGYDVAALNQAANYTAETNAAWSKYGAEVRGAGLYVDTNPQIIRRAAVGGVQTYTQNIKVRFLQPPPIPPPGVSHNFV